MLHETHELKVTHRDLNPQNLFLDEQDQLRIGDFGMSIQTTFGSSWVGTPGYAAPEILKGQYDRSADMWSVGCVLLDLLTLTTAADVVGIEKKKRIELIPKFYHQKWSDMAANLLLDDPNGRMKAMEFAAALLEIRGSLVSSFPLYSAQSKPLSLASSFRISLYSQVASSGNVYAQTILGYCYHRGMSGVKIDYKEAYKWYELASKQGHSDGDAGLAHLYLFGRGVETNTEKALGLIQLAISKGNVRGEGILGAWN